jgi:hypothetical protein
MPTDRLYGDIVRELRMGKLHDVTFEKIAVRIANYFGVRVLPMPGGLDEGYDGTIVDADGGRLPGPLMATMQRDGLANLRKNLRMHSSTYPDAAKTAFFATTYPKTNRQKQNLTKEAQMMGYTLLGIADEPAVAEYLYYHPDSCEELLGFRGVPSAFSPLPPRRRQHWDFDLVGRDTFLDHLRHLNGDTMLVGIPGSGKTSLLSQAAAEGLGLFARTADRDRLAPELREHRPKAVFVDGLDQQLGAVQALVSLRQESGIRFNIVVTGWWEDEGIVELLGLAPDRRMRLERLELDELVEVVRGVGLLGPRGLVSNIVHQAGGSPGLAVTLAMACRNGNVGEVVTGTILLRQVRMALRSLALDERTAEAALAAISVGGDSGMKPDDVAEAIDVPPLKLRRLLQDIEAGGVIRPKVSGHVSVQPEHLRSALVATNFYGGYPTSIRPLLELAPDRTAALLTLITAAQVGREPAELRELLSTQDSSVFEAYASLGPQQCRWVMAAHPDYLIAVSHVALHYIPEEVLPLLIAAAKGDDRQLHNTPEQPLRIIRDWCQGARPGAGAAVPRREMIVKAALEYLDDTDDVQTAARAFSQALTTEYDASYADPGQGMTITLEWSVLTPDEIEGVTGLWRRCCDSLRGRGGLPWRILLDAARNAVSLRRVDHEECVAESRAAARRLRETMATDIFELGQGHPAVAHQARKLTNKHESWPAESEWELLYALLFDDPFGGDYREQEAEVAAQLTVLAEEWSHGDPDEAMGILASLSTASAEVGDRGIDRRYFLGHQLSDRVDVLPWLEAAIRNDLDYPAVIPLLKRAISTNAPGWSDKARSCIGTASEAACVEGALIAGGPAELLADVVPLLPKYTGLVGMVCIRNEASPNVLHALLSHEDDRLASDAAIHVWLGAKGSIGEAAKATWRHAILRSTHENSTIGDILSADATLAFEWLKRRIEADDWRTLMQEHVVRRASEPLTDAQRVTLLLLRRTQPVRLQRVVGPLFGDSIEVFTRVLAGGGRDLCLMALERPKDDVWAALVVVGYEGGIIIDDLALASNWVSGTWGPESASLQTRIERVATFLEDRREPVRRVALRMTELLVADRERALAREREERVWGR